MLALIPQSGDFSGAALGVRSVALLHPETYREFHTRFSKIKFLTNFLNISLRMCRKMITFVPEFNLREKVAEIRL